MFKLKLTSRELTFASALAAISAVLQLYHLGYQSPQWGMWIDLVAVSWITAYFLFGIRASFLVSLLGAIVITLFAPDTWLGASMKWVATIPIMLLLFLFFNVTKQEINKYRQIKNLILPLFLGIILRNLIVIPLNYFYAIPIWTGMSSAQAMAAIPWYIIFIFNAIQSIIDVFFAWLLVFSFRLERFASWKN
ncbi:hypothetical protein A2W14_03985 [Candidatus Gottesmanbacteria bacterium RBG_16_37_8]|uniref:ECF transporter S component n=1 Tax=Candidatus Gottesmanbacteria bacterium RBG_16_37_8 TaxID=1798371 RepID=A0A1F5YUY6_9BACT|nr:MAG: hypothetical protein A2W14_03985 [Candidatus Gottesmanbacteria bacterium RBG_16_37_8]